MKTEVIVGDVLEASADVLVSTANPWLNMSGGVNGAIREQFPEIQTELREHLVEIGQSSVPAGTVVRTSAGSLPFDHIIHAVAIDPFYDSSPEIVRSTLAAAFDLAISLGARSISMPTLATGYGHLSIETFSHAFAEFISRDFKLDALFLVVRSSKNADIISAALADER